MAQWWIHIDLAGIQRYVYRSRTLLDGIGRAAQIADATDRDHLARATIGGTPVLPAGIEVRYGAAGALILSTPAEDTDDPEHPPPRVRAAVGSYTRWLHDLSDALTPIVVIRHVPTGGERSAHLAATDLLRWKRHRMVPGVGGALPPGVLPCALTGAPAEDWRPLGESVISPVAIDAMRAREHGRDWHERRSAALVATAPLPDAIAVTLPTLIDQLGRTESVSSHVAVMVIDVNDLGAALRTLPGGDLDAHSEIAAHLTALAEELSTHLVHRVCGAVEIIDGTPTVVGTPRELGFPLHRDSRGGPISSSRSAGPTSGTDSHDRNTGEDTEEGKWLLPLRPWVIAGDDLVLVCESRLAWDLATAAMDWISARADDGARAELCKLGAAFGADRSLSLTLGIGIAVVPVGYSLAAAHDLAAGLCAHAKKHRRSKHWRGHIVDWHRGTATIAEVLASRSHPDRRSGHRPYHRLPSHLPQSVIRPAATWDELLQVLDADTPGSLRSHDGGNDAHGWASRHGWIKSDLSAAARSRQSGAVDRALAAKTARETLLTGAGMPPLTSGAETASAAATRSDDLAGLLVDAIDLLDDHLQLQRVPRTPR